MSGHTPGPWEFVPWHIAEGPSEVRAPAGWLICTASSDDDARAIASVPNMLTALNAMVTVAEGQGPRWRAKLPDGDSPLGLALAAIAKATGAAPANRDESTQDTTVIVPNQPYAALVAERDALRKISADLLDHVDRETCTHEITHRGGSIWTICEGCGRKWADDEGGFKPQVDAPEVVRARAALSPDASQREA